MNGRDFREATATPDDAIALIQGFAYTARYGKQSLGYFATKREACYDAARKAGVAYRIHKQSGLITLVRIDESTTVESPAESIARTIKEQVGAQHGPLSPLAKQRVIMLLRATCKDKELSKETFDVLYPASSAEQFERLWNSVDSPSPVSAQDCVLEYAKARGIEAAAEKILSGKDPSTENITAQQFDDLVEKAVETGAIPASDVQRLDSAASTIARHSAEQRVSGDIISLIRSNKGILRMAQHGDESGIVTELRDSGYHRREAEEMASEIVSIGKLLK